MMDELGDRLDQVDGLRVYRWPPSSVSVPAAVVSYPDLIDFDGAYTRGMDRMTLPVVVLVGKPSDRGARDVIARYCDGSGPASVKQLLDGGGWTAMDSVRVTQVEFTVVTVGTTDYLAATFELDIVGQGAS